MQPGAGQVPERLRHEGRRHARLVRQRVHHVAEENEPVGRGECVGVAEVLLELAVRVFVVVGVVRPAELVHVLRHRGEVVEHPGEALGVVAGRLRPVQRVGQLDAALGAPAHEEVLRLASGVVDQAALARLLEHSLQDQPRGVRPRLALDVNVALEHRQPRMPRRERVRLRIWYRDHVGVRGGLAHRPGREAREARPAARQDVERLQRDHLRARLSVHIDEHGEEELDTVRLCSRPQLRLDVGHVHAPLWSLWSPVRLTRLRRCSQIRPESGTDGSKPRPSLGKQSGQCFLLRHDRPRLRPTYCVVKLPELPRSGAGRGHRGQTRGPAAEPRGRLKGALSWPHAAVRDRTRISDAFTVHTSTVLRINMVVTDGSAPRAR